MSENDQPTAKKTLGLTGLTVNAMALIAPGAFLWLTFAEQALYGQPMAGIAMWFGILVALLLCLATPFLMPNCQNSILAPVRRTSSPNRLFSRNRKPFDLPGSQSLRWDGLAISTTGSTPV